MERMAFRPPKGFRSGSKKELKSLAIGRHDADVPVSFEARLRDTGEVGNIPVQPEVFQELDRNRLAAGIQLRET
jgi:hypothetical protein